MELQASTFLGMESFLLREVEPLRHMVATRGMRGRKMLTHQQQAVAVVQVRELEVPVVLVLAHLEVHNADMTVVKAALWG